MEKPGHGLQESLGVFWLCFARGHNQSGHLVTNRDKARFSCWLEGSPYPIKAEVRSLKEILEYGGKILK